MTDLISLRRLAFAALVAGGCLALPASAQTMTEEAEDAPATRPSAGQAQASGGQGSGAQAGESVELDQSSPKAAAKSFLRAAKAGDTDGMIELLNAEDEQTQEMLQTLVPMMSSMVELDSAMQEQFGQGLTQGGGMDMPEESEIDAATVEEDGDTAQLTVAEQDEPMSLVRRDGKWYIDLSEDMEAMDAQQLEQMKKVVPAMASGVREVAQGVRQGNYASVEEAENALQQRMMQAMMQAMQPGAE